METTVLTTKDDYRNLLIQVNQVFDLLDVSESTRAEYKQRINLFLVFVKKQGFNRNSFLEFKRWLANRTDYSVSTKNKYLATGRVFLKELNRQGVLPADITQNIKAFSQSKRHRRDGLNGDEITTLTTYLRTLSDTEQTTRVKAIFSLLILQGLRQCEIARLRFQDFDPLNKTAFILGKGRDDLEKIYLHPETVRHLQIYIKTNRLADGFLFPSRSNNNRNRKMTVRGLGELIKTVLRELGIEKSPHGFRHYFTSRLIKDYKGDLLEVARYTRHKSLEMLQVYNDNIKAKADLPRYYRVFSDVEF